MYMCFVYTISSMSEKYFRSVFVKAARAVASFKMQKTPQTADNCYQTFHLDIKLHCPLTSVTRVRQLQEIIFFKTAV